MTESRHCPPEQEAANTASHAVGAFFSGVALFAMVYFAVTRTGGWDGWRLVGAVAFGGSLTAVLASSGVYHALPHGPWKERFQIMDHAAIYALIAGTTTPFALVLMKGTLLWLLMSVQWGGAVVGIALKVLYGPMQLRTLSYVLYIGMGGIAGVLGAPMFAALPWTVIALLVGGCALYLIGFVFFLWESLPYNHVVWHGFVLAASACHVMAALGSVF